MPPSVPAGLRDLLASLFPDLKIVDVKALAPDTAVAGATAKAVGYGLPLRVTLAGPGGRREVVAFRTARGDDFGHDRRSDRAEAMLLDFDTFARIPRHVRALDVGAIAADGRLVSLRDCGEFYLVTTWASGRLYADDLRRVARTGTLEPLDLARCEALARALVELHAEKHDRPAVYTRAVRDLVGHGEGIFGMVDGYGEGVPGAPPERLAAIERRCLEWRWRLRGRTGRLARTHGDYHPFNVVFDEGAAEPTLLDTSRGSEGDPADDVTCMAVNYVFFAMEAPASWRPALRVLWRRFFSVYLAESGDRDLLRVAPPWLAWRGLVLASPKFYPGMPAAARDAILGFVERTLDAGALDPEAAEALFP